MDLKLDIFWHQLSIKKKIFKNVLINLYVLSFIFYGTMNVYAQKGISKILTTKIKATFMKRPYRRPLSPVPQGHFPLFLG